MALPRRILFNGDPFDALMLNLWCIKTKTILFTGTIKAIAKHLNCPAGTVRSAYKIKSVMYKKYVLRLVSDKSETEESKK